MIGVGIFNEVGIWNDERGSLECKEVGIEEYKLRSPITHLHGKSYQFWKIIYIPFI